MRSFQQVDTENVGQLMQCQICACFSCYNSLVWHEWNFQHKAWSGMNRNMGVEWILSQKNYSQQINFAIEYICYGE